VFLGFHGANGVAHLLGAPIEWAATTLSVMQVIDIATVVIIGPNVFGGAQSDARDGGAVQRFRNVQAGEPVCAQAAASHRKRAIGTGLIRSRALRGNRTFSRCCLQGSQLNCL
jgi:hypothetical protein